MQYNDITSIAYQALLSQDFDCFPLELERFKHPDFYLLSYQQYAAIAGITVEALTSGYKLRDGYFIPSIHGKKLILYNADTPAGRRLFTIAHELGHAFLQHADSAAAQESEANFFAAQLLMPDAALNYLENSGEKISVATLQRLFGVSAAAAKIKLDCRKTAPCTDPRDALICSRFARYLRRHAKTLRRIDRQNEQALLRLEQARIDG